MIDNITCILIRQNLKCTAVNRTYQSLYIFGESLEKTVTVPLSINFNCHVLLRFAFILFFCVLTCVSETVKKKSAKNCFLFQEI